jgi:hypothetical protein
MNAMRWVAGAVVMVLALLLTAGAPAQAQLAKSGKAVLELIEHEDLVVEKIGPTAYFASGTHQGIQYNKSGEGFGHDMGYHCSVYFDITDLPKGVFAAFMAGCIVRDNEGDAIFSRFNCATTSWDDWCGGKILGGTGKYAGITGTVRNKGDGEYFRRRSCLVALKPDECKAYFTSSGSVPIGTTYALQSEGKSIEEWEWRIP